MNDETQQDNEQVRNAPAPAPETEVDPALEADVDQEEQTAAADELAAADDRIVTDDQVEVVLNAADRICATLYRIAEALGSDSIPFVDVSELDDIQRIEHGLENIVDALELLDLAKRQG